MNRTIGVLKMHTKDKFSVYFLPCIILFSSFFVNLIISFFIDVPLYTGGLFSIYVYMLVAGIITLTQTFPFALGLSVRRKDYFWGTTAMAVLTSVVYALALWGLSIVENSLAGWTTDLHFFHLPYVNDGNLFEQLIVYFIPLLHLYSIGFVISSVYRRFGRNGVFVLFIALFVVFSFSGLALTYLQLWGDIFGWMIGRSAFEYAMWLFPLTALYFCISYLLLRRATV